MHISIISYLDRCSTCKTCPFIVDYRCTKLNSEIQDIASKLEADCPEDMWNKTPTEVGINIHTQYEVFGGPEDLRPL